MGNSSSMGLVPDDLLEEIFLVLPAESIQSCRSVSKEWRSILESKRFMERRMSLQKSRRRILVAYHCECERWPRLLLPESRLEGDEEEMVYLHYNTKRPLMTCDGLICFPDQDWIHVLNPSTSQVRRFPTDLNTHNNKLWFRMGTRPWSCSMGDWSMGFGRDKVTGRFKIIKICYSRPGRECAVLDIETGDWRKLALPCYVHRLGNHSACANGSIYWLCNGYKKLLAFDLEKEEFHDVSVPDMFLKWNTQIVNLEDRLALARSEQVGHDWILEILTMVDAEEERWSKTYYIRLSDSLGRYYWFFRPVSISKQGNLVFDDDRNILYKYYPGTDKIRCLSTNTRVISPYLENLSPLPLKSSHPLPLPLNQYCPFSEPRSWKSYLFQLIKTRTTFYLLLLCTICFLHHVILYFYPPDQIGK